MLVVSAVKWGPSLCQLQGSGCEKDALESGTEWGLGQPGSSFPVNVCDSVAERRHPMAEAPAMVTGRGLVGGTLAPYAQDQGRGGSWTPSGEGLWPR